MFPEIRQRPDVVEQMNTPAKAKAWNALKEKTIVRIRKKDPTFFQRFGDAMQSGDHFKIRDAFAEAGKQITDTISTNGGAGSNRPCWRTSRPTSSSSPRRASSPPKNLAAETQTGKPAS